MKTMFHVLFSMVIVMGIAGFAHADLSIFDSHTILDDRGTVGDVTDDLFIYRNLPRFLDMTYAQQLASIGLLNTELDGFGPWQNNWHLAGLDEMQGLFDHMMLAVDADRTFAAPVYVSSFPTYYYSGRYEVAVNKDNPPGQSGTTPGHMWFEVYGDGVSSPKWSKEQDSVYDSSLYDGAWAVANRTVVPVPSAMLLGILGLSCSGWCIRRKHS